MSCEKKGGVTIKKLKELIKEELDGARVYRRLGFVALANDEVKHSRFLKKKLIELKKKIRRRK